MNANQYTQKTIEAIQAAQQLAAEFAGTMSGADACFFLKLEGETPVGFAEANRIICFAKEL